MTKVSADSTRTSGTNTSAMRSASRAIGAFEPWARSTSSTIRASAVSSPTCVARMTNVPVVLSVAPMTSSPGPLATGIGSPVSSDSSTAEAPSTTSPSTGILSPGRTRSRSPTATVSSGDLDVARRRRPAGPSSAPGPTSRRMAPDGPDLGARLEPPAEQHEPDDDRRGVEVGERLEAGRLHDRRPERHDDAVAPTPRSCRWRRACPCWSCRGGRPARPADRSDGRPRPG